MKDELGRKIMKSMTMTKMKKANGTKKYSIKGKLKFEDYKNCLKATKLENRINQLEKNKVDAESLRENHKEFSKDNKLILKSQQRFRSKKQNVFTGEVNEIALSANDDKRIQSMDSTETNAYRTSKNLVRKKEEIIRSNRLPTRY